RCSSRRRAPPRRAPARRAAKQASPGVEASSPDSLADVRSDSRDIVRPAGRQLDRELALSSLPVQPHTVLVAETGDESFAAARDEEILVIAGKAHFGPSGRRLTVVEHDAHERAASGAHRE